ncbi:hypothetical protein VTJ49DRAFT_567 [Mycothermus thermophilus]|uniref:Zn(2)-C6 fungal-type domain-containing protein n=1 Tax=Humicola insolens TaxID=85995 RepID=A0ABR3VEP9_HUMIN
MPLKPRRRPIPRKGHTKSRRGCYSCKRRKVKCQETLPKCANCLRLGLRCEYPPRKDLVRSLPEDDLYFPASPPSAPLQSTPTAFTADDLRFFHHFLTAAYPELPILGERIWQDVSAMSHSYDYLMHSMLGLAASRLTTSGQADFSAQGLAHRVKAIQSLNAALTTPPRSTAEADARYAAITSLTFQATCLPEGMREFLVMLRGCHILESSMREDSIFRSFTPACHEEAVRRIVPPNPIPLSEDQKALLNDCIASLRAIAPLCTSPLEVAWMAATERVLQLAKVSVTAGMARIPAHYAILNDAPDEQFAHFTSPSNHVAALLVLHFVVVEFAVAFASLGPLLTARFEYRRRAIVMWTERLAEALPEDMKRYIAWPLRFVTVEMKRALETWLREWEPRIDGYMGRLKTGTLGDVVGVGAGRWRAVVPHLS